MERLTDGLKKILLAGIGTVAVTAEKSKEGLDEMVKRGELTVEQGKVLNQELKHNIKDTVKKNVNVSVKPQSPEELLDKMTPEQIQALKSKLAQMDEADVDQEADESVFEDEDIVTDTSADGKSASGGESQTVDIKIEAEDDKEESVN
jgi:polyhydroxyalkanoate synthesis regulator phasin